MNDGLHMPDDFFRDQIQDGQLVAILIVKKTKPGIKHVLNHFSDMHLPMLLKVGRHKTIDGLHMYARHFFGDQIQNG